MREGAGETYDLLVKFIQSEAPDILCFQEANQWDAESRLSDFAQRTAFPYVAFGDSNTDFNLVTLSKLPIIQSRCLTETFWHSALHTTIQWHDQPLGLWNVHLDPRTPKNRSKEARALVSRIQPDANTIITGDFNSISRTDQYPANLLKTLLAANITKFGATRLSYEPMDQFEHARLADVAAALNTIEPTVPTRANHDHAHSVTLRLDYFLASPNCMDFITDIAVVKNDLTDQISDHYPVALTCS